MADLDRNQLALDNWHLIDLILNSTRSQWYNWNREDVKQAAIDGFGKAAARYDPSKGASFHTYASYRIKGAILDFIRSEQAITKVEKKCRDWTNEQYHAKTYDKKHVVQSNIDPAAFRRGILARSGGTF